MNNFSPITVLLGWFAGVYAGIFFVSLMVRPSAWIGILSLTILINILFYFSIYSDARINDN